VAFKGRRNFGVSKNDAIGEAAIVHQRAEAADPRFETVRFFVVNYDNLAEIQVHELTRGFFRFFIPEITERSGRALLDLPDDAIGGCAVHVDPRVGLDIENFAEALDAFRGVETQAGLPDDGDFAVGVGLFGTAHVDLRVTGKVYQGILKLRAGRIGRLVVEEAGEFGVVDDDRGVALNGVEVLFLEGIAGFRGDEHLSSKSNGSAGVLRSDGFFGGEGFVNPDDEFGNIVKPGELGVVDNQAEKLAGVDVAVLALVIAAFHVEKSFVEFEERKAKGDQFLAGGGIVVGGGQIGIWRGHCCEN
jgi:hypothetical protein